MGLHILRVVDDSEAGIHTARVATAGYIDGYAIADRLLEGVPIEFTLVDGDLRARIVIEASLARNMGVDVPGLEARALEWAKNGEFDVLGSTEAIADDDIVIFDDEKPLPDQAFYAAADFRVLTD